MVPPPSFASYEEVLPYLVRNQHLLTMTEFANACAWSLDAGFAQHNNIVDYMRSLRTLQHDQLPMEQDCPICFKLYSTHSSCDIPAVLLRCGHIVGSDCLYEWLKGQDSCPQCHTKQNFFPTQPQQHLSPRHAQVMRGILESGKEFLLEIGLGSGSVQVKGYDAFRTWAYTNPGGNHASLVARVHARAHILRWEAYKSMSDF